jgi:hypothetical protein
MGKSIIADLLRDKNYRYFNDFGKRVKQIGLSTTIKELTSYYIKYSSFPSLIDGQISDFKYKLFVFYNYFKIISVHTNISYEDLMNYFPTRLQKYFIYKLDPKEMREKTYNKILFYQRLSEVNLPFPKVIFYVKDIEKFQLNGEKYLTDQVNLPEKMFAKPISENGGSKSGIISVFQINTIADGFMVQELAENHPDLITLAGTYAFNTVRIISYIDNQNNLTILSAIIRLSKGKQVDNWGKGSINVSVDIKTGQLGLVGITKRNERYTRHPAGLVDFEGFRVPCWDKLIDIVKKGCDAFPNLRFIAWDIGISIKGPVIVEANAGCDFFHAQLFQPYGDSVLIRNLISG